MSIMHSTLLCMMCVLACVSISSAKPTTENVWYSACATSYPSTDSDSTFPVYQLKNSYDSTCAAYGYYTDNIDTTGWSSMHIESNPSLSGSDQSYAAGWLEGALPGVALRMYQSKINVWASTFTNATAPESAYDWIAQQYQWVQQQLANNPQSNYWNQVMNVYTQVQGIYDGYQTAATVEQPMTAREVLMLNLQAEVGDIILAIDPVFRAAMDPLQMNDLARVKATLMTNSHCSALIRLSPDGNDLFSAHTTWTDYCQMLRVYKYYKLSLGTSAYSTQFSSYFGVVHSIDDYYQTSSNMVVIETTNSVANMSLYEYVKPASVPTFVRIVVSNRLTSTGKDWASTYAQYNSGTYNNQWMIVDHKEFTPGQGAAIGTLYIASQIPGQVEIADVTDVLNKQKYWASYNIPYFPDLWTTLGYGSLVQQYGANGEYLWSYDNSFRALIFARDAPSVAGMVDMQGIMQENNWQTDPLSHDSADLAICARMDLSTGPLSTASASGSIDAKISSYSIMQSGTMTVLAKSGPTVESQAPFQWSQSAFNNVPHVGLPDLFNFDWVSFEIQSPPATHNSTQKIILTEQ